MNFTKSFTLIFFVFLLTTNCSKNEAPTPESSIEVEKPEEPEEPAEPVSEVYFRLNVDSTKDTSQTDDWVIIHKSTGELLDFKPYEAGNELIFEALDTELTDKITVSMFVYNAYTGNERHGIQTYTDISKGSTWRLPGPTDFVGTPIPLSGTFDVNIEGIPGAFETIEYSISNANGQIGGSAAKSNGGFGLTNLKLNNAEIRTSNDFIVSILDGNSNLNYLFINDVQDGDSFNFNYADFIPFDSTLSIDLPSTTTFQRYRVETFEEQSNPQRGYLLNSFVFSLLNPRVFDKLELGYLNIFDSYRTEFVVGFNGVVYTNISYGPKPESIIIPEDASLVVENQSISDFTFTINFDAVIRKFNSWSFSAGELDIDSRRTSWNVSSPGIDFPKLGDIPNELKEMYPNLNINAIEYSSSTFLTKSDSYQEHIARQFVDFDTTSELLNYESLYFAE